MQIIDGKATAALIKEEIAGEVERLVAAGGKRPHLAAVLVGHDGGSETYVRNKVLACESCGFKSTLIRYESDVTEEELLACVERLNADADIDGFIVQLPLPPHINKQRIIESIDYRKDVDGFHPVNVGRPPSVCPVTFPPRRKVFSRCCSATASPPAARSVWCWDAPTSWASQWPSS